MVPNAQGRDRRMPAEVRSLGSHTSMPTQINKCVSYYMGKFFFFFFGVFTLPKLKFYRVEIKYKVFAFCLKFFVSI